MSEIRRCDGLTERARGESASGIGIWPRPLQLKSTVCQVLIVPMMSALLVDHPQLSVGTLSRTIRSCVETDADAQAPHLPCWPNYPGRHRLDTHSDIDGHVAFQMDKPTKKLAGYKVTDTIDAASVPLSRVCVLRVHSVTIPIHPVCSMDERRRTDQ